VLTAVSVIVPAPTFVSEPLLPEMTPSTVVDASLLPVVRFFDPRT
jgi:hypothetical protein